MEKQNLSLFLSFRGINMVDFYTIWMLSDLGLWDCSSFNVVESLICFTFDVAELMLWLNLLYSITFDVAELMLGVLLSITRNVLSSKKENLQAFDIFSCYVKNRKFSVNLLLKRCTQPDMHMYRLIGLFVLVTPLLVLSLYG